MSRFDDEAETWDDEAKLERTRRVAELLRDHLPLRGDERVLDVGAGTGQLSLHLADAVGGVVVTDASRGMVEVATRNIAEAGLSEKMSAAQVDLTTEDTTLGPFDGVWSMLAFHHVPELERLLARVHESLRPGGWLVVVDLDQDPDGAFHAHVGDDFEGHHGFDRVGFSQQLEAAGFTDVRTMDAGHVDKELEGHGAHAHHERDDHGSDGHEGHGHDSHGGHEGDVRAFPMFLAIATRR